ncbi:MAG TPA: aminodeoxychorismate/anthranilate synthase component II [Cellvibrionaceae bacterium]|nr:aminodeoxychorismate/anthranilate synthase component II [Cellvibrionaceae bacterium]HMW71809.1 aminodeoxychorismate/anthranilate synthase component II [Cellvibrionaceae bacterium]HNG58613.1 aminodeoxychorismate/anthranilate synthase component II [Cellvibrionaceae bacterium]
MVLMLDNYDSFTYNLVHYIQELGFGVRVVANDEWSLEQVGDFAPSHIVISPGPCTPNEAGISLQVIARFGGLVPILGVCLGHQAIGQALGGQVVRAPRAVHGKTSLVHHDGKGVFAGVPNPFSAVRYHSLVLAEDNLPAELEVSAWTESPNEPAVIMGVRHKFWPLEGVQFHPESILSEHGHQLLQNFLRL